MMWVDGRRRKSEKSTAAFLRRINWHPYFAWWPTKLDEPRSTTAWLQWVECKYNPPPLGEGMWRTGWWEYRLPVVEKG